MIDAAAPYADRLRPSLGSALPAQTGGAVQALLVLATIAWLNYTIHGYRLPWQPIVVSDQNSGAALRQVLFAGAGMLALFRLVTTRTLGLVLAHHLPWAFLALALLVSVLWSEMPGTSAKRALIFGFGLTVLASMTHSTRQPAQLMFRVVVYSAGFSAIVSICAMVALPAGCSSIESRPGLAGISNHPNSLSAVMFTGWILALAFQPCSALECWWLRLNRLAIAIALILTVSVTGILVAAVGTVIYYVLMTSSYRRGVALIAWAVAISVVVFIGAAQVKSMAFHAVDRDESLSGRDTLWEDVYREASERPLFGSGFGGFWYEGRGREITGTWNPRQSHLAYLDVFVDLGALGLIAVLGLTVWPLVLMLWSIGFTANRRGRAAVAGMLALGFSMLALYAMSQSFLLKLDQFAMLTLLWCLLLLGNRDRNSIGCEFGDAPQ